MIGGLQFYFCLLFDLDDVSATVTKTDLKLFILKQMMHCFWLVGYCVSILGLFCSGYDCGCPVMILVFFVKVRKSCYHYKLLKAMVDNTINLPS